MKKIVTLLLSIALLTGCVPTAADVIRESQTARTTQTRPQAASQPATQPKPKPELPAAVTEDDYETIETGDDCSELVARFGKPMTESRSETDVPGLGRMTMDMYMWRGEGLFSSITVMCQDGVVYMKTNTKF